MASLISSLGNKVHKNARSKEEEGVKTRKAGEFGLGGRRLSYSEPGKALRELSSRLNRLGGEVSPKEVDFYRVAFNELLESFEEQKSRLDSLWESAASKPSPIAPEVSKRSSQISSELQSLQSQALEVSVELEMHNDLVSVEEDGGNEEGTRESERKYGTPLGRYVRRYHEVLQNLLKKSDEYQKLTQEHIPETSLSGKEE